MHTVYVAGWAPKDSLDIVKKSLASAEIRTPAGHIIARRCSDFCQLVSFMERLLAYCRNLARLVDVLRHVYMVHTCMCCEHCDAAASGPEIAPRGQA